MAIIPVHRREAETESYTSSSGCSAAVETVACVFLILTWVTVLNRFWVRSRIVKCVGWDDISMGVTMVFFTVFESASYIAGKLPMDEYPNMTSQQMITAQTWLMVAEAFYVLTLIAFKISLGAFFLRITTKLWHRYVIYSAMVVSTVFGLAFFLATIFACRYSEPHWEAHMRQRWWSTNCIAIPILVDLTYAHAAIVSATDWAFVVLPLVILRKTKMPVKEKVTVGFILFLAIAGSVSSFIRIRFVYQVHSVDINLTEFALWSVLEPGIGIIANCLATYRPLLKCCSSKQRSSPAASRGVSTRTRTEYCSRHSHLRASGMFGQDFESDRADSMGGRSNATAGMEGGEVKTPASMLAK